MANDLSSAVPSSVTGARVNLSGTAYAALRARLRQGLLTPQDRWVDLELAAALGMSRMPVREALLQLVAEGCLVSTARGYRLPVLSRQDVVDVFEVRALLEPRAAALAARDLSAPQLARLQAALALAGDAVAAQDFSGLFVANLEFREAWLDAVRNQRLAAAIGRLGDQVITVRHVTLGDPSVQRVVLEGQQRLMRCFEQRDSVAAHDAMAAFVQSARQCFLQQIDGQALAGAAPGAGSRAVRGARP